MSAEIISAVLNTLGGTMNIAAAPGTIELAVLTAAGLLPARRPPAHSANLPPTAIVVPAYNEEDGIGGTLASIRREIGGDPGIELFVVADNCTDATADIAMRAAATVLVRQDPDRRGKGHALDFAFRRILERGFEALIVIDADTRPERGAINAIRLRLGAGADAVQCRYTVANPESSIRTRLMNIALLAFNVMRPRGRDRLGLSCGILGNGFGLRRETVDDVPYEAGSVVEDLEYHIRLVRAGKRVQFADEATVRGEMPACGPGAETQRARWDGGRFRMIAEAPLPLAREVLKGRWRLLEPLLELLLLPLAFHTFVLLLALLAVDPLLRTVALAQIGVAGVHVIVSALRCGGGLQSLAALAAAPFYLLWKVSLLAAMFQTARRDAAWVRTARERANGGKL